MSEKQKIYDIINSILKDNQCIREDTLTHKLFDWLGDVKGLTRKFTLGIV